MAFLTAADVAHYFLVMQDTSGASDRITNLKIQKLCYYAQGFALVKLQRPLFFDDIEHWQHGPAIKSLWRQYREFGSNPIPVPPNPNIEFISPEIRSLLDDVMNEYGQTSALELRNQTHQEAPWLDTPDGAPITHQKMRTYFLPMVHNIVASDQRDMVDNERESLNIRMATDSEFMEATERGLAELVAGRFSRIEDVRRSLGDV